MSALGIDFKLFLGQVINFLILLIILWRFAYKPILKMLNDRKAKIAESLENAKKIEENLAVSKQQTAEALDTARVQSEKMIEESKRLASEQKSEIINLAKTQAEKETEKGKLAIQAEKEKASETLQKEVTRLVALATEKVLIKQASPELQQAAIDEAIEELG